MVLLVVKGLYRNNDVTELQCSVLVKKKNTIPAHGGLRWRSVQKHEKTFGGTEPQDGVK